MKKKILAMVMAVIVVLSAVTGVVSYAAGINLDFTPNTPIAYHDINKYLFMEKEFSTGRIKDVEDGDWKYYYWCDFKPQYTADYSFNIRSEFQLKCEIYDADNTLLAAGYSDTKKGDDRLFHLELTHRLEENKQYYFKFAFTEGNYDTVGKFWVYFSSNGSDRVVSADNLHLLVNGSSTAYTYYLEDYSVAQLFQDLELAVVFKDGSFAKWLSRENPQHVLNGVDILLNSSDCRAEPGQHTLIAHYLGYEVRATFNIVECNHQYKANSIIEPLWKQQGKVNYKCEKCGKSYSEFTPTAEELKPVVEASLNTKFGDAGFNAAADINKDNAVNARDVAIIMKAYDDYASPKHMKGEGVSETFN